MMAQKFKLLILSLTIFAAANASFVRASGIQVSPSELELALTDKTASQTQLVVANPTANVQLLEIYPDAYETLLKINPASFTLEAGERKTVTITAQANKTQSPTGQVLATNLSIIAKPLSDKDLTIGAGVKIPIRVTFHKPPSDNYTFYVTGAALLVIIVISILIILINKKRAKQS
jgi:hypothetical protein